MQLKIYKRCSLLMALLIVLTCGLSVLVWLNREVLKDKIFLVLSGLVVFIFIAMFFVVRYEQRADKNIITDMTENGEIALARINSGEFVRFARDSKLTRYVFWKLNCTLYLQDGRTIEKEVIDKFSPKQTKIPKGNIYVTYDENDPEKIFVIPNAVIATFPDLQPITESYENNKDIKLFYLNCYYNRGLIIETYKQSMKKEA